ncbi:MAG: ABC transporter permease [Candidatus Bipolaricaulota bacterium]|nr:ABC transporter permease [Candidatus Bipolaricaulota bacterium]
MRQERKADFLASLAQRRRTLAKGWYKYSRNPLSVLGLVVLVLIGLAAALAPHITPYPAQAGAYTDFQNAGKPPSFEHFFGTDRIGRDVFTRVVFGYRFSLLLGIVVLGLGVAPGVVLGLIAGYHRGTWVEAVIMRTTDVFLAVPPLVLALAITAMLTPNLLNEMFAIALLWWPWYCRLVFAVSSSLRSQFFVREAELSGASEAHILFREMLPNCLAPILTKMTLDMGIVILLGASLSFIGLGAQPPTPCLGTMVADGAKRLPGEWWGTIFPALAIVIVILAFNLVGDGLRDVFAVEEV